jgi:hypothetical protein
LYEPPVPKTAEGYYYYRDKKIASSLPQFPFSKEGERKSLYPRFTVGTGKAILQRGGGSYLEFARNMFLRITVIQK